MFRVEDLKDDPRGEIFVLMEDFKSFERGDEFMCFVESCWEPDDDYMNVDNYIVGSDLFGMELEDGSGEFDVKIGMLINHIELAELFKSIVEIRGEKIDKLLTQ